MVISDQSWARVKACVFTDIHIQAYSLNYLKSAFFGNQGTKYFFSYNVLNHRKHFDSEGFREILFLVYLIC